MIRNIALLFGITLLPFLELRASIPVGILGGRLDLPLGISLQGLGLNWWWVFIVCVVSNMILGIILYPIIDKFIHLLGHIPLFGRFWKRHIIRTQQRIHPYVERWGTLGVALFVAIPLPGSGSYSGAIGAYLLGLGYRSFILANMLGVFLAGVAVTAITLTSAGLFKAIFFL